jgi:hypothetical protein
MSHYWRRRADHVKGHVTIFDILSHFGIPLQTRSHGEVTHPCPLHGDGRDGKASAKAYADSQKSFCWACGKARDIIAFTADHENLSFSEAVKYVERVFHVTPLHGYDPQEMAEDGSDTVLMSELKAILDPKKLESKDHFVQLDKVLLRSNMKLELKMKCYALRDILEHDHHKGVDVTSKIVSLIEKVKSFEEV